jgi:hypothetical protein
MLPSSGISHQVIVSSLDVSMNRSEHGDKIRSPDHSQLDELDY